MVERMETLRSAPKIIDVLGVIPPNRSTFARALARELSADLVIDQVSKNPFRRRYLEDPKKWGVKYHTRSIAEKMGNLQRLIKKGESRRIVVFPSFEMDRLSIEVERKRGLINKRDYELFMELFRAFKDMRAMRVPEMTLCLRTKPTNAFEKSLAIAVRDAIEKRDERFIMFFDLDNPNSYEERLHHMSRWINYRFDDTDQ